MGNKSSSGSAPNSPRSVGPFSPRGPDEPLGCIFDFEVMPAKGDTAVSLKEYAGKRAYLIVNAASQ